MNKHMPWDLKQMQSLPLEAKIRMTEQRIRQWYEHWDGQVYVSFSGGKDSTVLKHIVDQMYNYVPAVFVNTGLEYPEIQNFVKDIKNGKYDCFNSDIEILRPQMRFDEVIKKYGYPVISKDIAKRVKDGRAAIKNGNDNSYALLQMRGEYLTPDGKKSPYNCEKWFFLLDSPFNISGKCCDVMKKRPIHKYENKTGRKPIIGVMADESRQRFAAWLKNGCNAFDKKKPSSQPLSFWTEQDILHYIKEMNVPYCTVYGDIVFDAHIIDKNVTQGQVNIIDYLGCYEPQDKLTTTGCDRTGCVFCMFGCHLEKGQNRFQRLKQTHPRQYEYCINGGEMVDGKWQPNKEGLGLGKVLDYIGVKYD